MMNYACAFSQSESEKYFEWIIIIVYVINSIHYQSALFKQSTSALLEMRSLVHSRWDPAAASCKALFKSLLRCSISTPQEIKNFSRSMCPWRDATMIGVSPDFKWTQFNIALRSALDSTSLINSSRLLLCTRRRGEGYSRKSSALSRYINHWN